MSSTRHPFHRWQWLAWLAPAVAAGVGALVVLRYRDVPALAPAVETPARGVTWPVTPAPATGLLWSVFEDRDAVAPANVGKLARRFRLAGTFLYADVVSGAEVRKAILDDATRKPSQAIVTEGDELDGVHVVRVLFDRVVLRAGGQEEELWLSFARAGAGGAGGKTNGTDNVAGGGAAGAFGGEQVGENRWVFQRADLLAYYDQLRNEPERLVQVFDSLEPEVNATTGRITGYRLNVKGEAAFFNAVGLKPGDVVRAVNQVPMTSRNRAEFFIKEFVQNRANGFILELDRADKREKLLYEVR